MLATAGFTLGSMARYTWRLGGLHGTIVAIPSLVVVLLGALAVFLTLTYLVRAGAYRRLLSTGRLGGYLQVAQAVTVGMAIVIMASTALQQYTVSRLAYIYAWAAMIALICAGRLAREALLSRAYRRGQGVRRVLVVGATPTGKMVMQNLARRRGSGYHLVGFIHAGDEMPERFGRFAGMGTLAELDRVLLEQAIDEVIVALPSASHTHIADIFARCERYGLTTKIVPDLFDLRLSRVRMDGVAGSR